MITLHQATIVRNRRDAAASVEGQETAEVMLGDQNTHNVSPESLSAIRSSAFMDKLRFCSVQLPLSFFARHANNIVQIIWVCGVSSTSEMVARRVTNAVAAIPPKVRSGVIKRLADRVSRAAG